MDNSKIIKGDELMLFKDGRSLAFATAHTLSLTGNTLDIATKDHGFWGASEVGNITWEITSENLYTDAAYDELVEAMINKQALYVSFAHAKDYDANGLGNREFWETDELRGEFWHPRNIAYFAGQAYITNLTTNANTGENATYSVTLTGIGPFKKNGQIRPDVPPLGYHPQRDIAEFMDDMIDIQPQNLHDGFEDGSHGGTGVTMDEIYSELTATFTESGQVFIIDTINPDEHPNGAYVLITWDLYGEEWHTTTPMDNDSLYGFCMRDKDDKNWRFMPGIFHTDCWTYGAFVVWIGGSNYPTTNLYYGIEMGQPLDGYMNVTIKNPKYKVLAYT